MFTQRHYEACAEALKFRWHLCQLMADEYHTAFFLVLSGIVALFAEDNPNFKRRKFYEAIFGKEIPPFSD